MTQRDLLQFVKVIRLTLEGLLTTVNDLERRLKENDNG